MTRRPASRDTGRDSRSHSASVLSSRSCTSRLTASDQMDVSCLCMVRGRLMVRGACGCLLRRIVLSETVCGTSLPGGGMSRVERRLARRVQGCYSCPFLASPALDAGAAGTGKSTSYPRSEEHTSELQSRENLV